MCEELGEGFYPRTRVPDGVTIEPVAISDRWVVVGLLDPWHPKGVVKYRASCLRKENCDDSYNIAGIYSHAEGSTPTVALELAKKRLLDVIEPYLDDLRLKAS